MPKKRKELSEKELLELGIYKGYDIRWLRQEPDHPDYHVVAEYDKKAKAKK